jgi:hypothetical protein
MLTTYSSFFYCANTYSDTGPPFQSSNPKEPWLSHLNADSWQRSNHYFNILDLTCIWLSSELGSNSWPLDQRPKTPLSHWLFCKWKSVDQDYQILINAWYITLFLWVLTVNCFFFSFSWYRIIVLNFNQCICQNHSWKWYLMTKFSRTPKFRILFDIDLLTLPLTE